MANSELVFHTMCEWSQNWEGVDVFSIKSIAKRLNLSIYKTTKAMHELRDSGLVERASRGRPAVCSYGDVVELMYEAAPPINGFQITWAGMDTVEFKEAQKKFDDDMRKWAEKSCNAPLWDEEEEKLMDSERKNKKCTGKNDMTGMDLEKDTSAATVR